MDVGEGLDGKAADRALADPDEDGVAQLAEDDGPQARKTIGDDEADGTKADLLKVPGGASACPITEANVASRPNTIHMEGRETFKHAVTRMCQASEQALEMAGLTKDDIAMVIPHQANARIISVIAERLGVPPEKTFINLDQYGNTSAATIPVALDEAHRQGKIKRGDIVLLVAFCLLMEALFTASEMVLVSADRHKLTERSRRGDRGADLALDLLSKPERPLATTLTATNVFVVLSSVVVTSRLLPRFGELP